MKLKKGNLASLSGNLATMVPGVPYAIAAKFAHPNRPVICFVGDGAFQMLGMNEMLTVKRYMERWQDKRLIFCVFNNQDLNQVTWEQRVMEGDPKFRGTQWLPDFEYAKYAELVGLKGIFCDSGDAMRGAWEEALAADRPVVLEVKTDPEVPPLPPHITFEQAKKMAKAMRERRPRAHRRHGEVVSREAHRVPHALVRIEVDAVTVPTDEPESDGTLEWDSTTIVIVRRSTRASATRTATPRPRSLIRDTLADSVREDVRTSWLAMNKAVRNMGRPGIASCAISAVDQALWDREGAPPRRRARRPARRRARRRPDLRQRRLLLVHRRPPAGAARRTGPPQGSRA